MSSKHSREEAAPVHRSPKKSKQATEYDSVPSQADIDGLEALVRQARSPVTLSEFTERHAAEWRTLHAAVSGYYLHTEEAKTQLAPLRVPRLLVWLLAVELMRGDLPLRDLLDREALSARLMLLDPADESLFASLVRKDLQDLGDASLLRRLERAYMLPMAERGGDMSEGGAGAGAGAGGEWSPKELASLADLYKKPGQVLYAFITEHASWHTWSYLAPLIRKLLGRISSDPAHLRETFAVLKEVVVLRRSKRTQRGATRSANSAESNSARWGSRERKMAAQMLLSLQVASLSGCHDDPSDWCDTRARWFVFLQDSADLDFATGEQLPPQPTSDDGGRHLLFNLNTL